MSRPRRVLILAYFFPPLGGAGVQRTLKFVKYLPEHGFAPTVITTRSRRYEVHDESLAAEIPPGTPVLRTVDLPLPTIAAGVLRRLGLRRLAEVVAWPDICLGWAVAATWRAWRAIRRERPDVILTTAPPWSAHLAGWALHRLTGVPWVADFRDPWAGNDAASGEAALRRAMTQAAERGIAHDAAGIVTVADYFRIAGVPADDGRRLTIPNGVDEDDADGVAPPDGDRDSFRLSYVGSIYGDRDCAPVLAALRRLIDRGAIDPRRFELRVVGNVMLPRFEADAPVPLVRTGYVDHRQALAEMRASSALLLYVAPGSLAPSGKLFEYLATERPILCVARPENLAFRLVEEWSAGRAAAPWDAAGIEAAIADLYGRWAAGELGDVDGVRERVLQHYSRRALTGRLAAALEHARRGAAS